MSETSLQNRRRSQRVLLQVAVLVRTDMPGGKRLQIQAFTLVVNAHGALIALAMNVHPNELLAIKNSNSAEVKQSRVVLVGEGASRSEVAIEFTEPAPRFWHIDFPPADWKLLED